jgi:hypothetical protein
VWDAEIVLRSFYEANAKLWFICFSPAAKRDALVEEFWGSYASMHSHKKAFRALPAAELFGRQNKATEGAILSALSNQNIFDFGQSDKRARKALEQKWSFTEIIRCLAKNSSGVSELKDVLGLLHMYGQQSHLIHADESALDLMLDRELRPLEENQLLACAHVSRIFSDQTSLWTFSAMALAHRYEGKTEIESSLWAKCAMVHKLAKPFIDRFNESQAEFYRGVDEN